MDQAQVKPTEAVALLQSNDIDTRIRGIVETGKIIGSDPPIPYEHPDSFEFCTLPDRLYDLIFSENPAEGREAAYAFVANAKAYRHEFAGYQQYDELDKQKRVLFGQRLLEVFEQTNLRYCSYVDARRNGEGVRITIDLSRKLLFDIDGKSLLLPEIVWADDKFRLGTSLGFYGTYSNLVRKELSAQEKEEGYVVRATVDMTWAEPPRDMGRTHVCVVIGYQYTMGEVRVPVTD